MFPVGQCKGPGKLEVLSWRTGRFGPWKGDTGCWGSSGCSGICFLPLRWATWPTSVPVLLAWKPQCVLPNLAFCSLIQLWAVIALFTALLFAIVQASCCRRSSQDRAEDPCVNVVCFEMLKVSLGFFRYCCESSLFWESLSVFASFGSQSLASVYAKKECCWFLFQRA